MSLVYHNHVTCVPQSCHLYATTVSLVIIMSLVYHNCVTCVTIMSLVYHNHVTCMPQLCHMCHNNVTLMPQLCHLCHNNVSTVSQSRHLCVANMMLDTREQCWQYVDAVFFRSNWDWVHRQEVDHAHKHNHRVSPISISPNHQPSTGKQSEPQVTCMSHDIHAPNKVYWTYGMVPEVKVVQLSSSGIWIHGWYVPSAANG